MSLGWGSGAENSHEAPGCPWEDPVCAFSPFPLPLSPFLSDRGRCFLLFWIWRRLLSGSPFSPWFVLFSRSHGVTAAAGWRGGGRHPLALAAGDGPRPVLEWPLTSQDKQTDLTMLCFADTRRDPIFKCFAQDSYVSVPWEAGLPFSVPVMSGSSSGIESRRRREGGQLFHSLPPPSGAAGLMEEPPVLRSVYVILL